MIIKVSIPNRFQLKTIPSFRTVLMPRQGEVHYIGGADILPAPLETEEEGRMISLLGSEDDKEARAALIEHNLRLVVYIAKKFDNTSVGVEDLISIGTIGLIKAINTFKPDKSMLTMATSSWPPMLPDALRMRFSCISEGIIRHVWKCP